MLSVECFRDRHVRQTFCGIRQLPYRQRLVNTALTHIVTTSSPLITTPAMAAARYPPRIHPMMLTISAIGGASITVSPPRAEKGELHPGLKTIIITMTVGATSDSQKPTSPELEERITGGV